MYWVCVTCWDPSPTADPWQSTRSKRFHGDLAELSPAVDELNRIRRVGEDQVDAAGFDARRFNQLAGSAVLDADALVDGVLLQLDDQSGVITADGPVIPGLAASVVD